MVILLPNEVEGLTHTEALNRTENRLIHHITGLLGRLQRRWLNIKLPKFVLEQEAALKQYLQLIGADDMFDAKTAELDGIGIDPSTQRLHVRELVHKVGMNE